jgi:hypothetical protein
MYLNAVRSVRAIAPHDALLIVDNASPQQDLQDALLAIADTDPGIRVVIRPQNELANGKVGGLYEAYGLIFEAAQEGGFSLVHLMQADMQLLWWDEDLLTKAMDIFERRPMCVNICTLALSEDIYQLSTDIVVDNPTGDAVLTKYGITDAGLFHMDRWNAHRLEFGVAESEHARGALDRGFEVVACPWPTDVQVPWPAVIRQGKQRGREVRTRKPYLCRPLDEKAIVEIKRSPSSATLEQVCEPWGWSCLSPMWTTDLHGINYWVHRRRAIRTYGWRRGLPRWVIRGLDRPIDVFSSPHRPSLLALVVFPAIAALRELCRKVSEAIH